MRVRVRTLKRFLIVAGIATGLLAVAIPALADYTGPDREVSTWSWERLVCDYQAVYDPPGPGFYGCGLTLYVPPDGNCESNVDDYFTSSACGWPVGINCNTVNCDVSRSSSIDSCNQGQSGCREVEHIASQPPATISGSVTCGVPGSGGWCRGDGDLSLSGSEPLSGYSILALEGTQNGAPFACAGSSCDVPLAEGSNNFSFWAISSYGDSSNLGSASGSLDGGDPALSGSASGTPGDNGWYVSSVTVEASASDAVSGLASLEVQIDGGGWSGYGGPMAIGDGQHDVELRAVDAAGNSQTQSLSIDVDTQSPTVDLFASPSFCPGCGEALDITVVVQDGGSGIVGWSLAASGFSVATGVGQIGQTMLWNGGSLGGGAHVLELEGRDEAGNGSSASFDFAVIVPTPVPNRDDDEGKRPARFTLPSLTPTATSTTAAGSRQAPTRTSAATRTPITVLFGGLPAAPAGPSSADDSISGLRSPSSSPPSAVPGVPSGVLYGAAAAALIATATAIGLETKRRREAEEARVRAEMAALNAKAATEEAEWRATLGQIVSQATSGTSPSPGWLAGAAAVAAEAARRLTRKEAQLEPKLPPPQAPLDLAKLKQADYAAGEAWERERAYAAYRDGERRSVPIVPPAVAWWQKGWADARATQHTVVDWIDQHQVAVSVAVGVVVAATIILLTAGTATPLVVAGLAALAAGGSVGLGTINLNSYYDRPWSENLLRNAALAVGGATVLTTGWWLASSGVITQAVLGAGNAVAGACAVHPMVCARIEPALQLIDTGEQLWLSAQLAVQTATRDPRAGETYLELQLEQADGGVPGNTALRELGEVGQDAMEALTRYGDEGAAIAEVVAEHSDDVVDVLDGGIVLVEPDEAQAFAEDLLSNLKALEAGDIRVYYSSASGAVYTSAPTAKALDAVDQLTAIVKSGRTSGADVDELVGIIAAESSRGGGSRVVLGKYAPNGVYIREALDEGGAFYDTGGVVYERLQALQELGFDPVRVNEAFLKLQMEEGIPRIEVAKETITEVLTLRGNSITAAEIRYLDTWAAQHGYVMEGNAWVLQGQ